MAVSRRVRGVYFCATSFLRGLLERAKVLLDEGFKFLLRTNRLVRQPPSLSVDGESSCRLDKHPISLTLFYNELIEKVFVFVFGGSALA